MSEFGGGQTPSGERVAFLFTRPSLLNHRSDIMETIYSKFPDLTIDVGVCGQNCSFLACDTSHVWVLIFKDEYDSEWIGSQLFPSLCDAMCWGRYVQNDMELCVSFRPILLHDLFSKRRLESLVSHMVY